ncbi:ATP-binding cassette sub-family C member 4-like isoform X1 [Parasteatoda tepidariorum]|uniref:ATP-binding cassette sub-family C member 4-like isoform X1 n=1 Tax=Parasteatoda tepidariorum TaxID=114398 RepID=UPI001C721F5A|nr:ATP-binding cassette sub-family C member 4-like isoform X2 [Parasteatoda tepidariorum]
MEFEKRKELPNPWTKANFFSRLFFWWLTPFFMKGRKGNLKLTDIYDCPTVDESDKISDVLIKEWEKELKKQKEGKKPSLFKATIRSFGLFYCLNGIYTLIEECFIHVMQPIFLGYLIEHFARLTVMPKPSLYMYTSFVCLLACMFVFTHHKYFFGAQRMGMRLRVACCALIYRKSLKLSQAALSRTTVGQMVNLLSNDVNRFDQSVVYLPYLVAGPIQTAIIIAVLWSHINYASLAGVSVLLLYIPFQGLMGKLFSKLRIKTAGLTDERIRLMNEIISGMRVIKMYGWEFPFANLVDLARRKEIRKIRMTSILRGVNLAVFFISSKLILLISFVVFVLGVKGDLTPEKVFVCMSLFNNLRLAMTLFFPYAIAQGAESLISLKRIQKFLLLEEQQETALLDVSNLRPKLSQCGIYMEKVCASWNKDGESTLRNVTLTVKPGELLALVGPVGCGKTSLLMSILGELPITSGEVKVRGKVAYAAQEAWVFGGTVKQNVIFGSTFDENRYKKVLNVCALDKDIELFPYGDQTAVGERGVSLSGGQKARVNLARAMYFDADIFLLDDPLSAVDAHVSKHLFEKCINGYLKDKVRILATHQIQFLKGATQILVLKEGRCLALGSYEQLIEMGVDLGSLMEDYEHDRRQRLASMTSMTASIHEEITDITGPIPIYESTQSIASSVSAEFNQADEHEEKVPKGPEELKTSGAVTFKVYKEYIKSGAGCCMRIILLLAYIITQVIFNGSDFWLTAWTNSEQRRYNIKDCWGNTTKSALNETRLYNDTYGLFDPEYFRYNIANVSDDCFKVTMNYLKDEEDASAEVRTSFNLSVYAGLVLLVFLLSLFRTTGFFHMCMKASVNLHNKMFRCVLRSPVSFFDSNPVGNILNRCSRDLGIIDDVIPPTAFDTIEIFCNIMGIICVVAIVEYLLLIPTLVISIAFIFIRRFYLPTARDVKRYEGITRSPVFSHLSTSLYGLTTIRAFKVQQPFEVSFDHYQDQHTATWFMFISVTRWFGIVLDWLCVIYITFVTWSMVILSEDPSYASKAGLAIASALQLSGSFQWGVRQSAEVESQMTSVERVVEYSNLPPEAALESEKEKKPPKGWPSKGYIVYQNVNLRYSPDEPPVLKNLNFEIYPEEKIGIVGRTGAGKSSMIATLFRMTEPEGEVKIDSICTKDIGLHDLRRKISIIPQDPVLFTGPVRRNLDPFQEHKDEELWLALEEAYLKESIEEMPGGLDTEVAEGGSNFSVGQRQLICLARAILRRNRILVLDEATANVDPNTDSLIQKTIRERFATCTVLTIAHRLHTIMDSDRVLVLDAGEVKEFDEPYTLLQNRNSQFSHMVQQTGHGMANQLKEIARTAYLKRAGTKKDTGTIVFGGHGGGDIIEMNGSAPNTNHIANGRMMNSDISTSDVHENTEMTYL